MNTTHLLLKIPLLKIETAASANGGWEIFGKFKQSQKSEKEVNSHKLTKLLILNVWFLIEPTVQMTPIMLGVNVLFPVTGEAVIAQGQATDKPVNANQNA